LLVDATPGQEPQTHELPEGAASPIGVMEGDLAIHWESKTGIITANPIERWGPEGASGAASNVRQPPF